MSENNADRISIHMIHSPFGEGSKGVALKTGAFVASFGFLIALGAVTAGKSYAFPYAPGETLDPACHPTDANCSVQIPSFTPSGDLSGNATSQTVIGLQGHPVDSTTPTSSQVLQWNGSAWTPETLSTSTGTNYWSSTSTGIYYNASGSVAIGATVVASSLNNQTGTAYTLTTADNGRILTFTNAGAITLTVPLGLPVGFSCLVVQLGVGAVTPTASGTTIVQRQSLTKTAGQYAIATLLSYVPDTFILAGDLQ